MNRQKNEKMGENELGEFLNFVYQDFNYKLFVPGDEHTYKECPLLVMLHGCNQNPDDFAAGTNMNNLAEKEGFFVLYPDMNHPLNFADPAAFNPFGCWNWFLDRNQHRGEGHPKLIYEMINEVKRDYKIDENNIFAAGFSAGGSLACILGVTYPEIFQGIAIYSGLAYGAASVSLLMDPTANEARRRMVKGVPDPYQCAELAFYEMGENKKKMRVIVLHGNSDTVVNPINSEQVIIQWAQTNYLVNGGIGLADVTPAQVDSHDINGRSYTRSIFYDGDDEPLLELWLIDELGHAWSGGCQAGSFTDPSGPNATKIIWDFLYNQHHQEEKIMETHVKEPSPAFGEESLQSIEQTTSHTPVQLPVETSVHTLENPPIQEPISRETELPPIVTAAKTSTEKETVQQAESSNKTPIRNFFKAILAKFMKKKNKKR